MKLSISNPLVELSIMADTIHREPSQLTTIELYGVDYYGYNVCVFKRDMFKREWGVLYILNVKSKGCNTPN